MKTLTLGFLATVLWMSATSISKADVFTLTDEFYVDGFGFAGIGTLQYTGASALPDGTYALNSFVSPDLSVTTGPSININLAFGFDFTQDDLVTTSSDVDVEISGSYFLFTNVNTYGDGIAGGSADFINGGGDVLSTQPGEPGGNFVTNPFFGTSGFTNSPQFLLGDLEGPEAGGVYGAAVPEPSDWAWVAVLGTVGIVMVRRMRVKAS